MLSRLYAFAAATLTFPPLLRAHGGSLQLLAARKFVTSHTSAAKSDISKESIGSQLFSHEISQPIGNKVTIVGCGGVGMATAFSLLTQNVSNEICLIDLDEKRLRGEVADLQQGSSFLNSPKITGSCDFAASACSRICVVTAGVRQTEGETRLELVERNGEIYKEMIPQLVEHSPDAILLIVTNPVDVMTFVAWKVSQLPKKRVLGSGTMLDSSRFSHFIAERLRVSPSCCNGWIIGEHGNSSVAVWSGVEVAGVRLRELNADIGLKEDPEEWHLVHKQVVGAAYAVRMDKGSTSWATALSCTGIVSAILSNTDKIMAVTTLAKGQHCIEDEVFMSLPCTLNSSGVSAIVQLVLSEDEREALLKSAKILRETQAKIKF